MWDLTDVTAESHVLEHKGGKRDLAFSEDGLWLAAAATNEEEEKYEIRIWNLEKAIGADKNTPVQPLHILEQPMQGEFPNLGSFGPKNLKLVFTTSNARLLITSLSPSGAVQESKYLGNRSHGYSAGEAVFTPDGKRAITAEGLGRVSIWNLDESGAPEVQQFQAHSDLILDFDCDQSRQLVVTGSVDNTARVLNLRSPQERSLTLLHDADVHAVACGPNGRWIVTGSGETIRIWDMDIDANMERVNRFTGREFTEEERAKYFPPTTEAKLR